MKKIRSLGALALCCILLFLALPVYAREIIDETYTPLPGTQMDDQGYVAVEATPPLGFEGILCVELQRKGSFSKNTVELSSWSYYSGGAWLPEGTYTVKETYVKDSDHFTVTSDVTEVVVNHEEDAHITLTLQVDEAQEAEREEMAATFVPGSVPTFMEETESQEATDVTTTSTTPATFSEPPSDAKIAWIVASITFLLAAVVVTVTYIKKRYFE